MVNLQLDGPWQTGKKHRGRGSLNVFGKESPQNTRDNGGSYNELTGVHLTGYLFAFGYVCPIW